MKRSLPIAMLLLGGCGSPSGAPPSATVGGSVASGGHDGVLAGGTSGSTGPSGGGSGGAFAGASSATAGAGSGAFAGASSAQAGVGSGAFAGASSATAGAAGAAQEPPPPGRPRCIAPAGMGSPGTIEQAVSLLNVLPKPTSVACFVQSLDRPLTLVATSSVFSAQPAHSARSPRVFLKIGQLWLSIVIDGASSELLEFGYLMAAEQDQLRSIKGELHFPLTTAVDPGAPYQRVISGPGTLCRSCHYGERAEELPGIDNVFSSVALRPNPQTHVPIETLRVAAQTCDATVEPHRCEMLAAIFDGGPVIEGAFPPEMPTFF